MTAHPVGVALLPGVIPEEFREQPRWAVWCWGDVDPVTGKRKKPPFCAGDFNKHASSTNAATWTTYEQAVAVVEAGKADGIGFALQPPYVLVDADAELDEADHAAIINTLNSYTERSPSGTGYHVLVKASLNGRGRHPQGIGVFQQGRFVYMTGQHVAGTPTTVETRQDELDEILARFLPVVGEQVRPPSAPPVDVDDRDLLERAFNARNGVEFTRLWNGDTSAYPSRSESDLALINMIAFWAGPDPDRIDGLFRRSALMRPKWDRPDYRQRTIETALKGRTDFYRPPQVDKPDSRTNKRKPAPLSQKERPPPQVDDRWTNTEPADLASNPNILNRFTTDLRRAGVAGEQKLAQLVYLAITSRLLPWGTATNRPVSVLARGTTSTGKSHALNTVLKFFPGSAYVDLGSMSRRYLFYDEQTYSHRVLVIPEASQIIGDDELLSLVRILLSEGHILHGTVVGEGKPTAKTIRKEGPTALLMTTTKAYVDEELETRMLSLSTDDTPEQTRRVYEVYAALEREDSPRVDFEPWHDLQSWLSAEGVNRVFIPYVDALGQLMPTGATRLRRDFVSMLCLVRSHAILHQQTRDRDQQGRVVATIDDYRVVRELISELIAEGADAGVSPATRDTVNAANELIKGGKAFVTPKQLEGKLGVGRSATYSRIRKASAAGYIVDTSSKDERGMKIEIGTPLPGTAEFLPAVDAVNEFVHPLSTTPGGQGNPHQQGDPDGSSTSPACPPGTSETVVLGDPAYPTVLAAAVKNGHITIVEAEDRFALHKQVAVS